MSRDKNKWLMVKQGAEIPYPCFRTFDYKNLLTLHQLDLSSPETCLKRNSHKNDQLIVKQYTIDKQFYWLQLLYHVFVVFTIYILGLCKEKKICTAFSLIIQANLGTKQMRCKTKQLKAKAYENKWKQRQKPKF